MQYGCLWSPVQCNYFHPCGWLSSIFHTKIVLEDLYAISMLLRSGPIEWFPSLSMTLIDVPHKNSARSLEWIDTMYRCFWGVESNWIISILVDESHPYSIRKLVLEEAFEGLMQYGCFWSLFQSHYFCPSWWLSSKLQRKFVREACVGYEKWTGFQAGSQFESLKASHWVMPFKKPNCRVSYNVRTGPLKAWSNLYFNFIETLAGYLRKSKSWFQSLELIRLSIG
jgi:hypothetical protein